MYKLLLLQRTASGGFTLLELMICLVIVGVLSAIAMPNLLGNVSKAKEAEAQERVREFINSQATHRAEEGEFSNDWQKLSISDRSGNYTYEMFVLGNEAKIVAVPKNEDTKAVAGGVAVGPNLTFVSGICKALQPGKEFAVAGEIGFNLKNQVVTCGKGLKRL